MLTAWIEGIGLLGPGLSDWRTGQAILAGKAGYSPQASILPIPSSLPPAERRRASKVIKLALAVGEEAISSAERDPTTVQTVFCSSGGDGYNCHAICEALASSDRQISPTRFHNSVNNAPSGYWSIATGAMTASSVLCAFDASFGAGLLEAMTQVAVDGIRSLLIAYDAEYPEPLRSSRPIPDALGIALALAPDLSKRSLYKIRLSFTNDPAERLSEAPLEALRQDIPAARGLPLLQAIARREARTVVTDYLDNLRLAVELEPCS